MAHAMKPLESDLTPAERDVFAELVNSGDGLLAIAKRLGRSTNTVRNQTAGILAKTGCESRVELMFRFYKARERELRKRRKT